MKTSAFSIYRFGPGAIRISVGSPRFIKGAGKMPFVPELAPQRDWLKLPKSEYAVLFEQKLAQLDAQEIYYKCVKLAEPHEPVLLCFEKPPFTETNFCHRHMVAEWFERELGIQVSEYGVEEQVKEH